MATKFLQKNIESDSVVFELGNGKRLVCEVKKLSKAMLEQLVKHGISQKVGDAAANCSKGEEYSRAMEQMSAVWENLLQDKWRESGASGNSVLIEALAEHTGKPADAVREAVNAADEEKLKTWRSNAKVKAIMARIAAERAAEKAENADEDEIEL